MKNKIRLLTVVALISSCVSAEPRQKLWVPDDGMATIFWLLVGIFTWFAIMRPIYLWYFKINQIIDTQEQIIRLLKGEQTDKDRGDA